jgi:glutaminyl-tRNA synthetase
MSDSSATPETAPAAPSDFIRDLVAADLAAGRHQQIHTRFPPEPNGYLHIGHAKSICLNFGIARQFGGVCNLRMDDTNPAKEDVEYVESILADVKWLIAGWADHCLGLKPKGKAPETKTVNGQTDFHLPPVVPPNPQSAIRNPQSDELEPFYASDYFDQLYAYAVQLIEKGKAYVCDLSAEDTDKFRGTPDRPGTNSPFRDRSVAENLDLFARMKAGEFPDGARTLRAKIDMAAPNIWLRDPLIYRIRHVAHHHTGDKWCLYPLYDFAHCLSDYLEGITHSVCTLEFEVHRPLYDWILESLGLPRPLPHQFEFAKLIPTHLIVSKRKLIALVNEGIVTGWDDPRLPTISGIRRRGVTAEALRNFAIGVGVTKFVSTTDIAVFEHAIREDLNQRALRRLAVLRPLKVVLTNLAPGEVIEFDAANHPTDPAAGTRKLPFTRELWIEQDDFMEVPPPKYFRLRPGGEVRLKYACIIRCDEVIKDAAGQVTELRCTADLDTRSGGPNAGKKVKGTIHWVSAAHAVDAPVRLYDRLFTEAEPEKDGRDYRTVLNPKSLETVAAKLEAALAHPAPGDRYQFERLGYFWPDPVDSRPGQPAYLRTLPLKDAWAKEAGKA